MPDKCAGHSLKAPRLSISRTTGTISRDRWLVSFVLRKVLDSKLLQNPLLEVYLASSKQHFLVLCLAIYSRAVNAELPLEEVLDEAFPYCRVWAQELRSLFAGYVAAKQSQRLMDYDDLLL